MKSTEIRRRSRSNFGLAFWGLPRPQKEALSALYAFCRTIDDIVDEALNEEAARKELDHWRVLLYRLKKPSLYDPPVAHELGKACRKYPVQVEDLHWIIDTVETDLWRTRFETFDELLAYCDGVASAVGLATLAILGANREETKDYAYATGRALQLTNIIRDVGTDARRGRIYLPREELQRFSYLERDLLLSVYNDQFVELMKFQVERARSFYAKSKEALSVVQRRDLPAAELMRKVYEALLHRIEARKYNVFPRKVRVSPARKLAIATSVWVPHLKQRWHSLESH